MCVSLFVCDVMYLPLDAIDRSVHLVIPLVFLSFDDMGHKSRNIKLRNYRELFIYHYGIFKLGCCLMRPTPVVFRRVKTYLRPQ